MVLLLASYVRYETFWFSRKLPSHRHIFLSGWLCFFLTELPYGLATVPRGPEEVCVSFHCHKLVTVDGFVEDEPLATDG